MLFCIEIYATAQATLSVIVTKVWSVNMHHPSGTLIQQSIQIQLKPSRRELPDSVHVLMIFQDILAFEIYCIDLISLYPITEKS